MIDFDKKLKKEYLHTENRNGRWNRVVASCIKKQKPFLLNLYTSNPFNPNNYYRRLRWDSIKIYNLIQNLNFSAVTDQEKLDLLDTYIRENVIQTYEYDGKNDIFYLTKMDGSVIEIKKISDFIKDEYFVKKLTTQERLGECHSGSMNLACVFENVSDIVIGWSRFYNNRNKLLHTWLEAKTSDGKEVVIDYTLNAIIDKKAYYELINVVPINRFESKFVRDDYEKLKKSSYKGINCRSYLIYHDEVMKAIEEEIKEKQDEKE